MGLQHSSLHQIVISRLRHSSLGEAEWKRPSPGDRDQKGGSEKKKVRDISKKDAMVGEIGSFGEEEKKFATKDSIGWDLKDEGSATA